MNFAVIARWTMLVVILWEAGSKIRAYRAGRFKGGMARSTLSVVGLVAVALFFALVIRWNEIVPVPLWWVASALVAVTVGLLAHRAVQATEPGGPPVTASSSS